MDGPLGHGHSLMTTLRLRLTRGSVKQALFSIYGPSSSGRCKVDVTLFALLAAALAAAAMPFLPLCHLPLCIRLATFLWTTLIARDRSAYCGAMGAYYFPMLLCCAFPEGSARPALQFAQVAHLLIPGIAKLGPWFDHVSPTSERPKPSNRMLAWSCTVPVPAHHEAVRVSPP